MICLIMILVSATASCTSGDAIIIGMALSMDLRSPFAPSPKQPSRPIEAPSNGFWFKPDTDVEQLKQDYSECRAIGNLLKGENSCMGEKGYTWASYYEE